MYDLQWRELQRANGSHRVGQGVSALGSSETTQAQISARKVTSPSARANPCGYNLKIIHVLEPADQSQH